ncbi:MAG: hypothetical protein ACK47B_13895 [Armatimonadota bacterium]
MRKLVALAALTLGLAAAPASAEPNFLGSTGLILTPTAATVGDQNVGAHAHFTDNFNTYGVLGAWSGVELGVTYFDPDGGDGDPIVNLKWNFLPETTLSPGVAVGVIDLFDEFDADPSWYIVASKTFPQFIPALGGLRLHAGFGGGIYDEEIFAGAELALGTPLDLLPVDRPTFTAIAEFANSDFNIGVRGRWRGFSATAALIDLDDFGFGFTYSTALR